MKTRQSNFSSSYLTIEYLQIINQLIKTSKALFLAFVDYEKVFDLIEHSVVFNSLQELHSNENYNKVIENTYGNCTAEIELRDI